MAKQIYPAWGMELKDRESALKMDQPAFQLGGIAFRGVQS
ncbi:Uncharacterised protein [Klebsiella variicola]|nr:hypothetical protein [Klebsiella sp. RC2]VED00012.1 Uncharacterised protein [Klebsiella variicola]